jgi:hypothetical protein
MGFEERRSSRRISVNIPAIIGSGGRNYPGYITNVSSQGIGYMIASLEVTAEELSTRKEQEGHLIKVPRQDIHEDFAPERVIEISFECAPGRRIKFQCLPAWVLIDSAEGKTAVGMSIIEPPPDYTRMVADLENKADQ